jgi:hypothetical protein
MLKAYLVDEHGEMSNSLLKQALFSVEFMSLV